MVDSRAVAEAILRSGVLVAAQPGDGAVRLRGGRARYRLTTSPIQVSGAAASAAARRSGGTVTSSS